MSLRPDAVVDLLIRGGTVVTAQGSVKANIAVSQGKITGIMGDSLVPAANRTIDCSGKFILPGIVDPEVHIGLHRPLADDFVSETRAAAATGITTWGLMLTSTNISQTYNPEPRPEEVQPYMAVMPVLLELADGRAMTDYFLTAKIMNDGHAREVPRLAREWGVTSFKTQLHLKSGAGAWSAWPSGRTQGHYGFDDGMVYLAMQQIAALGAPGIYCLHCENWEVARVIQEQLLAEGRRDMGAWDDRSPAFCEAGHVVAYSYYAKLTGCPIYIQHVTTPETVAAIVEAKAKGTMIYGQTGPHYLYLTKDVWKINVPLRDQQAVEGVWKGLREGHVNSIGSDHVNHHLPREKMEAKGDVWATVSGFSSRVEALLPVMLSEGVSKGRITLERLVAVCCEGPARLFGLYPKKGAIAVGSDADFVVVDLDLARTVSREMICTSAGWSIYEGHNFKGWPIMTILRGDVIMDWPAAAPAPRFPAQPKGEYQRRVVGKPLYPID
ncbi:MAG: amidohydrolase family protein [Chloroflexi bacterium]|nr:amidohydrolase family protein [Chloroflexota bacterium]